MLNLPQELDTPIAREVIALYGGIANADPSTCDHVWGFITPWQDVEKCQQCPTYRRAGARDQ